MDIVFIEMECILNSHRTEPERRASMDRTLSQPQYITDGEGHKTAVILSLDAYNDLLEDLYDLAATAERRNDETISHADLIASLKSDGLI